VRAAAGLLAVVGAFALSGCAAGPRYHWGHYEELLYEMYAEPGKADPAVQVERLSRDVAEAETKGLLVPPGVYAHLGYMYLLQGNAAAARDALQTEKRLYPESETFVDRLLAQAEGE
jgi:hypothetical protein